MARKLTFEEVKAEFDKKGYTLLETEYKNANTPMRYHCPKHPDKENRIRLSGLKSGKVCAYCAGRGEITFEEVKTEFDKRGYTLLETEYINSKTLMRYRCPNHPDKETKISLNVLRNGTGCAYCAGLAKYTFEEIKAEFEKRGYTLLETEYINNSTPMSYRCPKHPDKETKIILSSLKSGHGCAYYAGKAKITYKEAKREFEKRGYVLLETEYINISTPMRFRCPDHPDKNTKIALNSLKGGQGCAYCAGRGEITLEEAKGEFSKRGYVFDRSFLEWIFYPNYNSKEG